MLASTAIAKEVPRAHHFSRKLSGVETPGTSEEGVASIKALANERHEYGEDEEEQEEGDYAYEEQDLQPAPFLNVQYDLRSMHNVNPWCVKKPCIALCIKYGFLLISFLAGTELP